MTAPHYWQDAKKHLSRDKRFKKLIESYQGEWMTNLGKPFHTLARSIVGQQISVKAADSIWARLESLLCVMEAEEVGKHGDDALRACGLSQSKVNYLRNIAQAFQNGTVTPERWQQMDDEAIMAQLTTIKGIGRWTAEMFMIFYLHRPDIWPIDDIGVIKGVEKLTGAKTRPDKKQMIDIAEPWRPYRTVAAWYLWRSLDPVPVQY